jgi:hypothetical protein
MKRQDLEHIIRAAAAITDEKIFVVVGSQAILAQHPLAPAELLRSPEADLYPANRPELADVVEGAIGLESPFHRSFGYYAEGVGPETAKLPKDWGHRAVQLTGPATNGAVAICPEAHDLAASKLIAGREKDLSWVSAALGAGILGKDLLARRIDEIEIAQEVRDRALKRLRTIP